MNPLNYTSLNGGHHRQSAFSLTRQASAGNDQPSLPSIGAHLSRPILGKTINNKNHNNNGMRSNTSSIDGEKQHKDAAVDIWVLRDNFKNKANNNYSSLNNYESIYANQTNNYSIVNEDLDRLNIDLIELKTKNPAPDTTTSVSNTSNGNNNKNLQSILKVKNSTTTTSNSSSNSSTSSAPDESVEPESQHKSNNSQVRKKQIVWLKQHQQQEKQKHLDQLSVNSLSSDSYELRDSKQSSSSSSSATTNSDTSSTSTTTGSTCTSSTSTSASITFSYYSTSDTSSSDGTCASSSSSSSSSSTCSLNSLHFNADAIITTKTKNVRFVLTTNNNCKNSNNSSNNNNNNNNNNKTSEMKKIKQQPQQQHQQPSNLKPSSTASQSKAGKTKKVDFLDIKLNSFKANLLTGDNCINANKINCFNSVSSKSSSDLNQSPVPNAGDCGQPKTNEDSFADSNLSSSSSDVITSNNSSSSSCSSSTSSKNSTSSSSKLIVLSSVSSTSSGVGSSNISSASSTTSETPSSADIVQTTTASAAARSAKLVKTNQQHRMSMGSYQSTNYSVDTTTKTSGANKLAPKAVICDDGDIEIEIETPYKTAKSSLKRSDLVSPPRNQTTSANGNTDYRCNRLKSPDAQDPLVINGKQLNRNSNILITSRNNFNQLQQIQHFQKLQQQQQQQQRQSVSQNHYQTPNNQYQYQNQLAAAAAAAAAMDKEKQRDALLEYVKSQQLKQQQQQQQQNYQQSKYQHEQSYSNLLPRKQLFNNELDKHNSNENHQRTMSLRCNSANNSNCVNRTSIVFNNNNNNNSTNSVSNSNNTANSNSQKNSTTNMTIIKTPAKRDSSLGLCYLMYGPETKRTLLPSQVTGIDTVKALFVRSFPEKLTMNYLDDEQSVKIYIKDQLKDLFYQLDDMSDIKDRCVLKLVELATNSTPTAQQTNQQQINSSQLSLASNVTLINSQQQQQQQQQQQGQAAQCAGKQQMMLSQQQLTNPQQNTFTNCYGYESTINLCGDSASKTSMNNNNHHQYYVPASLTSTSLSSSTVSSSSNQKAQPYHLGAPSQQQFATAGAPGDASQGPAEQTMSQRSLSEPRPHHNNHHHLQLQQPPPPPPMQLSYTTDQQIYSHPNYQPFIHNHGRSSVAGEYTNPVETYDNLNESQAAAHQSRLDSQSQPGAQLSYFDRYNATMRPLYNSVRIPNERDAKSIERDVALYDQAAVARNAVIMGVGHKQTHKHRQSLMATSFIGAPNTAAAANHQRDIRSCERDSFMADLNAKINGNNSRSGSTTPANQAQQAPINRDLDATEEDELTMPSTSSCSVSLANRRSRLIKKALNGHGYYDAANDGDYNDEGDDEHENLDDTTTNTNNVEDEDEDADTTVNEEKERQQANGANDVDLDNSECESSRAKMKLMQRQLETLTNIVKNALISRDLNQLAAVANVGQLSGLSSSTNKRPNSAVICRQNLNRQSAGPLQLQKQHQQVQLRVKSTAFNSSTQYNQQSTGKSRVELNLLNEKTRSLKSDLCKLKKLQENFNSTFGDSMKSFVTQLNEKLKSYCLNEINEKIRLDLIIYKYQLDSSKIENELSDLESVVDDLRENILKHKCKVSIDDVECYALALSQLSKQLVSLKTSFSSIKEQFRSNSLTNDKQQQRCNSTNENKFLSIESSKLDLVIRRCKRITGILIVLKKLAISPRSQTQNRRKSATTSSNNIKRPSSTTQLASITESSSTTQPLAIDESPQPQEQADETAKNDSPINNQAPGLPPMESCSSSSAGSGKASENGSENDEQQTPVNPEDTNSSINANSLKDLGILKQIESIQPDYEQRQLAIEVDDAFNQLMNELSMITNDMNANGKKPVPMSSVSSLCSTTSLSSCSSSSSVNYNTTAAGSVPILNPSASFSILSTISFEPVGGQSNNHQAAEADDADDHSYASCEDTYTNNNNNNNSNQQLMIDENVSYCSQDETHKDEPYDKQTSSSSSSSSSTDNSALVDCAASAVAPLLTDLSLKSTETEAIIRKRCKFRMQKSQIKEEKELLMSSQSPASTTSSGQSNSPTSSLSSSPSSPLSPSPVQQQEQQSAKSTPSQCSNNNNNLLTQIFNATITNTNGSCSSSSQSATPPPPSSQHPLLKPNIMDRSFLETVHEEDATANETTTETSTKEEKVKSSLSIQPCMINGGLDSEGREKACVDLDHQLANESQLYDQLVQLKPLKSKSFKSSTSICLNVKETPSSSNGEKPCQQNGLLSSFTMNLTPNQTASSTFINLNNNKTNGSTTTTPTNSTNSPVTSKLSVRFSESLPVNGVNGAPKIITNGSMRLNRALDSSDSKHGALFNNNNNNTTDSTFMINQNNKFGSCKSTSVVIPRRNSSFIQSNAGLLNDHGMIFTNGTSNHHQPYSTNNGNTTSVSATSANAPRRVSLSVTDL